MTITPRRWCWNNAHCPSRAGRRLYLQRSASCFSHRAVVTVHHHAVWASPFPPLSGPSLPYPCLGLPFPTFVWAFPSLPLSGLPFPTFVWAFPSPPLSGPSLPHLCLGLPFPTFVWAFPSPPLSGPSFPTFVWAFPSPPLSGRTCSLSTTWYESNRACRVCVTCALFLYLVSWLPDCYDCISKAKSGKYGLPSNKHRFRI